MSHTTHEERQKVYADALEDYPFYMVLKFYNDTEVPHFQFEVHKGIKVTDWMELPRKEPPW